MPRFLTIPVLRLPNGREWPALLLAAVCFTLSPSRAIAVDTAFTRLAPGAVRQMGTTPEGTAAPDRLVLANEPDAPPASLTVDFDLAPFAHNLTPLARLVVRDVEKIKVTRPQNAGSERGVLHVSGPSEHGKGSAAVVAAFPVSPAGTPYTYTFNVTAAVNAALAQSAGQRKITLTLQLTGKPLPAEVYGVPTAKLALELAPLTGWVDDWRARMKPITEGESVYREASLPITAKRGQEVILPLLYPAKKIVEVIRNATGEKLTPGRDWILRDGQLVLPVGTQAPVQLADEFFSTTRTEKDGSSKTTHSAIRLMEGTWYHERQIEVTYEPAKRDWTLPAPLSKPSQLPRFQQKLQAHAPVTVILFGDSISAGFNSSAYTGTWPFQPSFGELVARQLARTGSPITFLNHSRGGETSLHATFLADAQVGWFKPDLVILALGMNDRSNERRPAYRANMEKIIDTIRTRSPDTEIIFVTPMLNSPEQPTGLGPVQEIRDQGLSIVRPGLAFVDMTSTQLELIKHKPYLDFSGNGVNHPNDFLIRLYAQRIAEVLVPQLKP